MAAEIRQGLRHGDWCSPGYDPVGVLHVLVMVDTSQSSRDAHRHPQGLLDDGLHVWQLFNQVPCWHSLAIGVGPDGRKFLAEMPQHVWVVEDVKGRYCQGVRRRFQSGAQKESSVHQHFELGLFRSWKLALQDLVKDGAVI